MICCGNKPLNVSTKFKSSAAQGDSVTLLYVATLPDHLQHETSLVNMAEEEGSRETHAVLHLNALAQK